MKTIRAPLHGPDRDRFVLPPGMARCLALQHLYLTGYDVPSIDQKQFRQWEAWTPWAILSVSHTRSETTTDRSVKVRQRGRHGHRGGYLAAPL